MLPTKSIFFRFSQKVFKNHYRTLRVGYTATAHEIKGAYKSLAKECHPDVNKGGEEQFKNINEAYEILSDAQSKRAYDMQYRHIFGRAEQKPKQSRKKTAKQQKFQDEDDPYKDQTLESLREMQRQYRQKYMRPKYNRVYSYRANFQDNEELGRMHRMHAKIHMRHPNPPSEPPEQSEPPKAEGYSQRYDRSKDSLMNFMTESARALGDVWRDMRKRK